MKKALITVALAGSLIFPAVGLAVTPETKCSEFTAEDTCIKNGCNWDNESSPKCFGLLVKDGVQSLINLINKIGNYAFVILLSVASLFLVYAGFLWTTAGGDPQGAQKARQMLTNALIGVVIALLARGIVQVVKSVVGG